VNGDGEALRRRRRFVRIEIAAVGADREEAPGDRLGLRRHAREEERGHLRPAPPASLRQNCLGIGLAMALAQHLQHQPVEMGAVGEGVAQLAAQNVFRCGHEASETRIHHQRWQITVAAESRRVRPLSGRRACRPQVSIGNKAACELVSLWSVVRTAAMREIREAQEINMRYRAFVLAAALAVGAASPSFAQVTRSEELPGNKPVATWSDQNRTYFRGYVRERKVPNAEYSSDLAAGAQVPSSIVVYRFEGDSAYARYRYARINNRYYIMDEQNRIIEHSSVD
jgi:hypothetical protein